jgi:uncharacterized protein YceK
MKSVLIFICTFLLLTGCSSEKTTSIKENNVPTSSEEIVEEWTVSPAFTISKPDSNGKDVPFGLIGVNGKLAIVDAPIKAGENNKQLFHFWEETPEKTEQLFNKQVKVNGISKEDGKTVTVFESSIGVPNEEIVKPPHHYAESVGYLNLPSKGIWKLEAYVEDTLFSSIIVEVQ